MGGIGGDDHPGHVDLVEQGWDLGDFHRVGQAVHRRRVDAATSRRSVPRPGAVRIPDPPELAVFFDSRGRADYAQLKELAARIARQSQLRTADSLWQAGAAFSIEQVWWLERIKDVIAVSVEISVDDLDGAPFTEHGGLDGFANAFGNRAEPLIDELNRELPA